MRSQFSASGLLWVGAALVAVLTLGCGYDFDAPFTQRAGAGGSSEAGGATGTGGAAGSTGGAGGTPSGGSGGVGGESGAAGATGGTGATSGFGGEGGTGGSTGGTGGTGGSTGGTGGGGSGGGPPPSCNVYSDLDCDSCAANNCEPQCAAVTAVPDADAFMECRDGCGWSFSCRAGCKNANPDIVPVMTDLENCIYDNCGVACGKFSCTEFTGGAEPDCDQCLATSCGAECAACQADADCPPYWNCFYWCGESGEVSCGTCSNFSDALDLMSNLFSTSGCVPANCDGLCF